MSMADDLVASFDPYEEMHNPHFEAWEDSEGVECRYCGKVGLHWEHGPEDSSKAQWRLFEENGQLHICLLDEMKSALGLK